MSAYNWFMIILVVVVSLVASFMFLKDTFKSGGTRGE